jgi:hypothetical protein
VNACLPIPIDIPMAFATEPVAFRKADQIPVIESQLISILRIVAVEAPSHCLGMMKPDL